MPAEARRGGQIQGVGVVSHPIWVLRTELWSSVRAASAHLSSLSLGILPRPWYSHSLKAATIARLARNLSSQARSLK